METKRKALGKGLEQLFSNEIIDFDNFEKDIIKEAKTNDIIEVPLNEIRSNPYQPRKSFIDDTLKELAESIKEVGIVQPILVKKSIKGYELIAGERRTKAARLAGLEKIPAIIKDFSDQEMMEIALIENIQREDLNPIEEALAYKRLLSEFNLKQDEVAERVSKSRTAVTNSMRLLKLCDKVQQMIIDDMISTGHARALISIEDPDEQYNIAQKVFDEKLSVRDVEKLVKNLNKPEKPKKEEVEDKSLDIIYQDIEEKLKQTLGTKVAISSKGNGAGKMEIEFYSHDDLDKLIDLLSSTNN